MGLHCIVESVSYAPLAQVAELVDALASGASVLMDVEVQVLSWAPINGNRQILFDRVVFAQVAELVDALASGASVLTDVEVQVLSWAPKPSRRHDAFLGMIHDGSPSVLVDSLHS